MNPLIELRTDLATALNEAGLRTVDWAETRFVPPMVVITPDSEYITQREGDRFGHFNVGIQVLVLGPERNTKAAAEAMDEMLLTAINALSDDFDIVSVTAPGEAALNEKFYYGSIISIEAQIILGKDN